MRKIRKDKTYNDKLKSELKYLIKKKAETGISIVINSPLDKNETKTIWPTWKILNTPFEKNLKIG